MGDWTRTRLGFDPCPGDPEEIQQLAGTWRDVAVLLTEVALRLDRTDEAQNNWKGEAANAFRDKLNRERTTVGKSRASCEQAADLLNRWADQLRVFQTEARRSGKPGGRSRGHTTPYRGHGTRSAHDDQFKEHMGGTRTERVALRVQNSGPAATGTLS